MNSDCLFCKIINKELPASIVFENDDIIVFNDINPRKPIHWLVVPKVHIENLNELSDKVLAGKLLTIINTLAKEHGFAEQGYRVLINTKGDGGQEVDHLHLHILAGAPVGPIVCP